MLRGAQIGTLLRVFRVLGTPTEEAWPGVVRLPHFFKGFPRFEAKEGRRRMFGGDGRMMMTARIKALLEALLALCPARRPTARQALVLWHGNNNKNTHV